MPIFCISDLHLCERGPRDTFVFDRREERFNNFLSMVEAAGGRLLILGDLFDWWKVNMGASINAYMPLVDRLDALGATWIVGNHDNALEPLIGSKLMLDHPLFQRSCRPFEEEIGGRRFAFLHGHEADPYCCDLNPGTGEITAVIAGMLEDRNRSPFTRSGHAIEDEFVGTLENALTLWRTLTFQHGRQAEMVAGVEKYRQLDNIYFARSADPNAPKWQVFDRRDRYGDIDTDFKDVVLRFNPAGGLKFLAEHAMGFKPKYHFKDVEPPAAWRPYELGYAPTALAVSSPERNWEVWGCKKGKQKIRVAVEEQLTDPALNLDDEHDDDDVVAKRAKPKAGEDALLGYAWPGVIDKHIEHWVTRPDAREYANDDIVYTRALDKHFEYPAPGDNDSTLACMVSVVRWHGFSINIPGMKQLLAKAEATVDRDGTCNTLTIPFRAHVDCPVDTTGLWGQDPFEAIERQRENLF
jgi:UDP-2,3-diacylglucosamine pyrophosphatase LpxH